MDGVINVYKPSGISSHDVIYKVRRILGTRKVGHTGTLDPMAEGVLPICVGKATKAVEYIMAAEKEYECRMQFGSETDTQDSTGNVTKTSDKRVTCAEFEETLQEFVGEIDQIPPMYSAVHHEGERLYKLARQGIEVERKTRKIQIFGIDLLEFDTESAKILVRCSKGTYIRTLCEDIGRHTGTLAHMTALKRTKSGVFGIENSIKIDEISEEKLINVDKMFEKYARIDLDSDDERRVLCGLTVRKNVEKGSIYRLYGTNANFLCLSKGTDENGRRILKMIKSFY